MSGRRAGRFRQGRLALRAVLFLFRPLVWGVAKLYFRISFEGLGHLPRTGPLLILPNHVSYADPVLVTIPLPPIYYLAWERFFRTPIFGHLLRWLGAVPVRIGEPDVKALKTVIRLLETGEKVVIFPEGGRAPDGKVQPFQPGAVRLALRLGVPVCPVTIAGAFEAWPLHRRFPRPGRVRVTFYPPITLNRRKTGATSDEEIKQLAEEIRQRLQRGLDESFRKEESPE